MANGLKNQVGKLWKGAVQQLEDVRHQVEKTVRARGKTARAQIGHEIERLRSERDRLLVKLGEQTLTWVNQSPVPMPAMVKKTVTRLNEVVESMKPQKPKASRTQETPVAASAPAKAANPVKAKAKKAKAAPKAKAVPKTAKAAAPKSASKPNKAPVGKKPLSA